MIVGVSFAAVYLILFGLVLRRRTTRNPAEGWLIAFCVYSAVLMALHALLLTESVVLPVPAGALAVGGFMISIALVGGLTLGYLALSRQMLIFWTVIWAIWGIGVIVAQASGAAPILGDQLGTGGIFGAPLTLTLEVLILGWALLSLFLFGLVGRAFLAERLPLYANRILFWAVILPLLLGGDALSAFLTPPFNLIGYGLRLAGAMGAVYGVISYRIVDLRDSVRRTIGSINPQAHAA